MTITSPCAGECTAAGAAIALSLRFCVPVQSPVSAMCRAGVGEGVPAGGCARLVV